MEGKVEFEGSSAARLGKKAVTKVDGPGQHPSFQKDFPK